MTAPVFRSALLASSALLVLAGCAGPTPPSVGSAAEPPESPAADTLLLAQGTVIQTGDDTPQLCLGPVLESYPIQCGGPEILGWEWWADDLSQEASGVRWGSFAVTGTWDGSAFTVDGDAVPLALYDPMMQEPDPRYDPANAGSTSEAEASEIGEELIDQLPGALSAVPNNGYLFVDVIYDDGSLQAWVDAQYGPDVVAVISTMTAVSDS